MVDALGGVEKKLGREVSEVFSPRSGRGRATPLTEVRKSARIQLIRSLMSLKTSWRALRDRSV
jgi:hypothetical protein